MNKFTLTLAAGAFALISACSEDKESDKSYAELCATPITAECLEGTWKLYKTSSFECEGTGTLTIDNITSETSGGYVMLGGVLGFTDETAARGSWTLNSSTISVAEMQYNENLSGTISVSFGGDTLKVTSSGQKAVFSLCDSELDKGNKTEEFYRQ